MTKAPAHRTVTVAACAVGVLLAAGGMAQAAQQHSAPADTTLVNKTGGTITVTAGIGVTNTVTVLRVGNEIRVRDTSDLVVPTGTCTSVSVNEAACPAAGTTRVVVYAGDRDDNVASGLAGVPTTLIGGPGADSLSSSGAGDTLQGDAGGDVLGGGPGPDTLDGGPGADTLNAGGGADTVSGGPGTDTANGGQGPDTVNGGGGGDSLDGGAGNDLITGGAGRDDIVAGAGSDDVRGNAGADVLNLVDGVRANDRGDGGAGTDLCLADPGDSTVNCE